MAAFLRLYATATAAGTHIGIPMVKAGTRDFAVNTDWTPATGDVKVSIDGGAQANIGTLPSYSNGQWLFQFTGAELTGKSIRVAIVDSATKAVDDQFFIVETYGHASALHPYLDATLIKDDGTATFDRTTDSLQALRDHGDASWVGEAGPTLADIKSKVVEALTVDTYPELTAVPAATTTLLARIQLIAMLMRNKVTQTNTTFTLYADDGTTVVATWGVSDSGTVFTSNEGA